MCDNFFDVRTFGAVMSTGINCGQVRGPVQLSFARSIEPVVPLEISITRMAATSEKEKAEREKGDGDEHRENRTMGRKHIVPYGLYRAHGFVSAKLAERTGFSQTDPATGRSPPGQFAASPAFFRLPSRHLKRSVSQAQ
jgi:CRISPR-associated protein Csd2